MGGGGGGRIYAFRRRGDIARGVVAILRTEWPEFTAYALRFHRPGGAGYPSFGELHLWGVAPASDRVPSPQIPWFWIPVLWRATPLGCSSGL